MVKKDGLISPSENIYILKQDPMIQPFIYGHIDVLEMDLWVMGGELNL
jgi:hypothetical protein